jgi:NAD-dependent SIR2 family protein deacetylase
VTFDLKNLLIVGAGFSWNAGLPLASGFTRELLNLHGLALDGPSARQVTFIRTFVDQAFGEGANGSSDDWPEMEDIFTMVDLSANTGHHLGPKYSASDLRVVRRSIIVRMIRMLSQAYTRRRKEPDSRWNTLERFFEEFDTASSAVLSMNWDTVFERGVARTQSIRNVEYGCGASAFHFEGGRLKQRRLTGDPLHILKPHGSVNWLYCDACREMFWLPPEHAEQVAQTLFRKKDWQAILGTAKLKPATVLKPLCPHCKGNSLGTRFATFSYRKALDFPMHAAGWRTAEEHLKSAHDWIFFGYSMPAADFEFKYLLKRVQLSERVRPRITVITGGSDATATVARFRKVFGSVAGERTYFKNGLDTKAIGHLRKIGVLKTLTASP